MYVSMLKRYLTGTVDPVFQPLMKIILMKMPEDLGAFCLEYFQSYCARHHGTGGGEWVTDQEIEEVFGRPGQVCAESKQTEEQKEWELGAKERGGELRGLPGAMPRANSWGSLSCGSLGSEPDSPFPELWAPGGQFRAFEGTEEQLKRSGFLMSSRENGHDCLRARIESQALDWRDLNARFAAAPDPANPKTWQVGFIADQDWDSRREEPATGRKYWESFFARGELRRLVVDSSAPATREAVSPSDTPPLQPPGVMSTAISYDFMLLGDTAVRTGECDKDARGAEYSTLEFWNGKMTVACDRTGNLDEIYVLPPGEASPYEATGGPRPRYGVRPVLGSGGQRVALARGAGKSRKSRKYAGLKCEWATQGPDGQLLVGSTGKERTDDGGKVVHRGEMWVKNLDASWGVAHEDWVDRFGKLREAAQCPHGEGYMIHEAVRWSEVHQRWFFFPRKLSREVYDERRDEFKCCNLFLSASKDLDPGSILLRPLLDFKNTRGCSDFFFIPGTNDCHLFVVRTQENGASPGFTDSFVSVVDLEGNVLMEERLLAKYRKFEGACVLPEHFH